MRSFSGSPGLFAAAVVTLALGIGATATIFGLANWLLLRPLPGVYESEDVASLWFGGPTETISGEGFSPAWVSYPNLHDIQSRLTRLSGLAGYQRGSVNAAADAAGDASGTTARRISVEWVSHSFFHVLGVRMVLGRPFTGAEDDPVGGGTPVAVIGHRLWTSMFGGEREVLGRTLWVNGVPYSVVGVAEERFQGTDRGRDVEAWLPRSTTSRARHQATLDFARRDQVGFYQFVARLAPGSTWEQVDAELAGLATWLGEEYPEANESFRENSFVRFGKIGAPGLGRDRITSTLWLLGTVVALVLLIACTNVANLLLMKGLRRRSELALRKALGAGRGRLLQQQLVEGSLLWLAGGAAGGVLAVAVAPLLEGRHFSFLPLRDVSFDARVFAFAAGTSLVVGLLFSSLPAVACSSTRAEAALKEGGSSAIARRSRLRGAFVVAQLAASLTLVVGALLLVRTLHNLTSVELGFDPQEVFLAFSNPGDHGYDSARRYAYYRELQDRLEARPEILEATVADRVPLGGALSSTRVRPAGKDEEVEPIEPLVNQVRSGYFELLRTPIVRGRSFTDEDFRPSGEPAADVVIVSEALARRLFGTLDVLGEEVEFPVRGRYGKTYRIVGVAADVQFMRLTEAPWPMIYEPLGLDSALGDFALGSAVIFLRPVSRDVEVVPVVREVVASLDATLPTSTLQSLEDTVERQLGDWNTLADLIGLLALIAVVLSAVGLHGVVGSDVVARTKEFGIRMTLGAESRKIFLLVLRDTAMIGLVGVLFGLGGAAAFARVLESRLFEITPFDPLTWMAAAFGLLLVAFSAAAVPAYRATRVDPIETLRVQ